MPVDIGPRIGLDGEAEFKQSLKAVDQQLKSMGAEMKAVVSAFDAGDRSEEALSAQNEVLAKSIAATEQKMQLLTNQLDRQQRKLSDLGTALEQAKKQYGENSAEASKAQNAYNKQYVEVGKLETQFNKTTESLNKMKSQISANEHSMNGLDDAMDDAEDSSGRLEKSFSALTVAAGNLISSGIETIVSGLTDLVGSIWNLDESTEEFRVAQGRLNTAFEAAGYSTEAARDAYQNFYKILGDTDTATEATQLLAQLAEREEDMAKWTEIAAGVSGTFGDSLPIESLIEAANETAKVGEVTGTLADALNWVGISEEEFNEKLSECSTEADRNQLIMETLSKQYDEAANSFHRNNSALEESRNIQVQMQDALGNLGGVIQNIKNELLTSLAPALTTVTTGFTNFLRGINTERITSAINQIFTAFSVGGTSEGFQQALTIIGSLGSQFIQTLYNGIMDGLPQLSSAAVSVMGELGNYLTQNLPVLIQNGLDAVSSFTASLRENAGLVIDGALGLAESLAQGLADSIPTIVENVPTIVTNIAGVINDNAPKIFEAAVNIITTLVQGLIDSIPTIIANIPEIINAIVNTILAFNWLNLGKNIITGLSNGIGSMVTAVKTAANRIVNTIKANISKLPSEMLSIGKNIVQGLWRGIQNMASWIRSQVSDFVSGIVSSVKNVLGIHSPSTVFAYMGKNMALGLGKGFGDEMRSVQRDINRSMEELSEPELNATYSESATASRSSSTQYQDSMANVIAAAVRDALQGASVYLNGRKVGTLVTQSQNASAVARGRSQVYV